MLSFISKIQSFIIKHLYAILGVCLLLGFLYPEYIKRQIYPYIFGVPTDITFEISEKDMIGKIDLPSFDYPYANDTLVLTPRATYSVTALVVDLERYDTLFEKFYHGHNKSRMLYNSFSPLDLLLGFSDMAKPEILKHYKFTHQYRGAIPKCNPCDGNPHEHMNNYHIIPATVSLKKAFEMVLKNEIIYLKGYLVDVDAPNMPHFKMNTGVSQNSYHENQFLGGMLTGMCFILYVDEMIINGRVYH